MTITKWLPEPNPWFQRRLGKTLEECGELVKICARIQIQGLHSYDPDSGKLNKWELEKEIADVLAQCECTLMALNLDQQYIKTRMLTKIKQMADYENHLKD